MVAQGERTGPRSGRLITLRLAVCVFALFAGVLCNRVSHRYADRAATIASIHNEWGRQKTYLLIVGERSADDPSFWKQYTRIVMPDVVGESEQPVFFESESGAFVQGQTGKFFGSLPETLAITTAWRMSTGTIVPKGDWKLAQVDPARANRLISELRRRSPDYARAFDGWVTASPHFTVRRVHETWYAVTLKCVGMALFAVTSIPLVAIVAHGVRVFYRRMESRCGHCGYDVTTIGSDVCPECGRRLPPIEEPAEQA